MLEVPAPPETVTDCNCSICGRRGVLWAKYPAGEVRFVRGTDATTPYIWGDRMIEFHHCATCGCTTHYVGTERAPRRDRIAVNARLMAFDREQPITVRRFDGAGSWTFVGEGNPWPW